MDDTISRQALMKEFSDFVRKSNNSDFAPTPTWNDAVSLVESMPSAERRGRWTIEAVHQYKLAHGTTAYEPIYRCSCCGLITESYLRFDKPIMPDDADFPKWCGNCGARMVEE